MIHASERLAQASDEVNRAQREYWSGEGPRQYQDHTDTNEALFAPFGQAMLDAARLQPGECVLDVGCGHGTSTFEAAERVAPSGRAVGVDISAAMLEPAHQRVTAAGLDNVELLQADAQVHGFDAGSFDVVISRFGIASRRAISVLSPATLEIEGTYDHHAKLGGALLIPEHNCVVVQNQVEDADGYSVVRWR